MRYAPIEDHGIIGDLHSAALVSSNGSIDWYCCPRFDSPSVFAALLDADQGGRFRIGPVTPDLRTRQLMAAMMMVAGLEFGEHRTNNLLQ